MVLMKINRKQYLELRKLSPYQFLETYFNIHSDRNDIKQNYQTLLMVWCQIRGIDLNSIYNEITADLDSHFNITLTHYSNKIINIC